MNQPYFIFLCRVKAKIKIKWLQRNIYLQQFSMHWENIFQTGKIETILKDIHQIVSDTLVCTFFNKNLLLVKIFMHLWFGKALEQKTSIPSDTCHGFPQNFCFIDINMQQDVRQNDEKKEAFSWLVLVYEKQNTAVFKPSKYEMSKSCVCLYIRK